MPDRSLRDAAHNANLPTLSPHQRIVGRSIGQPKTAQPVTPDGARQAAPTPLYPLSILRQSTSPASYLSRYSMGIYGQPNSWQCGPFALKHGLLALGLFAHEDELARLAGSSERDGTDEVGLGRAARALGCDLEVLRCRTAESARGTLTRQLARGVPVLLCIDQWDHWVTVVAERDGEFVLFDSYFDNVLRIEPWERLQRRLVFRERRFRGVWVRELYDLHPLIPRKTAGIRLGLTPDAATYLLNAADGTLTRSWDEYARHVLPLAVPQGAQLELALPLGSFLQRHRVAILERASASLGEAWRTAASRAFDRLIFVAGLYRAALLPEAEATAVDRLAAAIADLLPRDQVAAAAENAA